MGIVVTDDRLIVQGVPRKFEPHGEPISLPPERIADVRAEGGGGGWPEIGAAIIGKASVALKLRTSGGEKFKLLMMRGEGPLGGLGGGGDPAPGCAGTRLLVRATGGVVPGDGMTQGVKDTVDGARASGLRWLGVSLATLAFGLPAIAFLVALVLVDGHASIVYYEAIAQIIPIVILALAIELRYFAPGRGLPAPLKLLFRDPLRARVVGFVYAAATLLALVLSEAVALWVLAEGSSDQLQLSITTAGLTAGAVALVVAILLPAGKGNGS